MEKSFWETRYAEQGYAYGTEPNAFMVSQQFRFTPGQKVLLIGEGEGRNGVWLARQGLQVTAVDQSEVGLSKAQDLASQHGVSLETICVDLTSWNWPEAEFDFVISIFVHFPSAVRRRIHQACLAALKPGGSIIMEAFTPEQLQYSSGGPPVEDMLFREEELQEDFAPARIEYLESLKTELAEGKYHRGPAAVVRLIATRP